MPDELINQLSELLNQAQQGSQRYLKIYQAREYANVSEETFKKWRNQGLVPISVIEGVKRIDKNDIDKLMLSNKFGEVIK